ncbi:MAG: metal ABC transporter permease [Enterocloster bolteae]
MNLIREMLSYPFLVRALAGGMMVSLCASLLGVSLVLRRYSMIGDGLSHVSFGGPLRCPGHGLVPLKISIPVVVLAAFFLLRITENSRIKSDAAIALISASALALGIIVTSLTTGMTTDVSSYMFGSILAMSREDVWLSAVLSLVVLGLFVICYNRIFAVTFDENFCQGKQGSMWATCNIIIAVLTAVTIVLGMRMMGAMLISSLVIFPCLSSSAGIQKLWGRYGVLEASLSLACFFAGMVASYQFSTPAGASVRGGEPVRLPFVHGVAVPGPPERLMPPACCFVRRLFPVLQ